MQLNINFMTATLFKVPSNYVAGFSVEIFKGSPRDPFVFELGVPNKISVIKSLFYTVMSLCVPGTHCISFFASQYIFCVKYAIFCINENPDVVSSSITVLWFFFHCKSSSILFSCLFTFFLGFKT